mmetsp:Transcript_15089/g.29741  ORF Transcript_15089/g.29741 Transcript_15089/m.29741 type:complete len:435 (+) Transcript_15089:95-1399(+)
MSNTGKFRDSAPLLPAAGRTEAGGNTDSTAMCFTEQDRPPTPEHIRRFRKSYTGAPGMRVRHWGAERDAAPRPGDFVFGVKGEKDAGVEHLLGGHLEPTTMQAYQMMRAEMCYETSKVEVLGKTLNRRYDWPDNIKGDPNFRFGVPGAGDTEPAIEVVFPPDAPSLKTTAEQTAMYKRSHGAYEPGEQRKRDYTWDKIGGGIDPGSHAFGGTSAVDYKQGVAKALNPDLEYASKVKPTQFVPRTVADFHQVRADDLGKVRNLGLGDHKLPADHIYGMSTQKFNDWGAKECLSGNYSVDEQMPDPDLGRSLRRGCAPDHVLTSDRVFGVPCVRSDIAPPKRSSVADSKNYGNEPGVKALIYPQTFAQRGVYEEDFLEGHTREGLCDICVSSGMVDSQQHFDDLFERARGMYDAGEDDMLSVDAIRRALYAEVAAE